MSCDIIYLKLIRREENRDAETQTKTPTALGFLHMGSYILFELDSHVSFPPGIHDHIAYTADLSLR